MAAPTPTPSTLARPRIRRKSLDLFGGVRSSIKTPSFLLNFPLLEQYPTPFYHLRSLFAIGFSAIASTFAFFRVTVSLWPRYEFTKAPEPINLEEIVEALAYHPFLSMMDEGES